MVLAIVVALCGIYVVIVFNQMVRLRAFMHEAWSGIDVQLKRRHDLIPNLLETVKGYKQYEQAVLEKVTALRSPLDKDSSMAQKKEFENAYSAVLKTIFAIAENYPQLMADQSFIHLHQSLTEIEDSLQMARRYYNGTVRNSNICANSFPNFLFARNFGFLKSDYFEIEYATERQNPDVNFSN